MTDFESEEFCVDVTQSSMDHGNALSRVAGALYLDDPTRDWDGLKGSRINFVQNSNECWGIPLSQGVELRFFVYADEEMDMLCSVEVPDCSGTAEGEVFVGNTVNGHREHLRYVINLRESSLQNGSFYRGLVNHEAGHAFGLRDGGPTAPGVDNGSPCEDWVEPGPSIMHSYGCPHETWPTAGDRTGVGKMIPVISGTPRSFSFFGP